MVMSKSQHYCPYITFFTGNKSLKGLVVQHCLYDTLNTEMFFYSWLQEKPFEDRDEGL